MVKLPDRWINYSQCGEVIQGTRIICFKTPLRTNYFNWWRPTDADFKQVWDVAKLLERVPNLGLVIDLTYSTKYYDPKILVARGIKHKKILCEGHVIPKESVVNEFIRTIEDFVDSNRCNDKLIGVHCTHGLNRTGYLVCRYMIESLSISPTVAIEAFEKARGYPMERKNYLNSLLSFDGDQFNTRDY